MSSSFRSRGDEDIAVDSGAHRPGLRTHSTTAFFPRAIPGRPMPRYFSNGLLVRTGRTRTLTPSVSKSNLSPGRTPNARSNFVRNCYLSFAGDARCFLHDKFSVPCYGIPRLTIGTSRPGLFQKEGRPKVIESELLRRIVPILVFGLREPTDLSCCTHKLLCVSNSAG